MTDKHEALNPGSNGVYIDAQRSGSLDRIELVRAGQVKQRFFEYPKDAPERIITLIKELTCSLTPKNG